MSRTVSVVTDPDGSVSVIVKTTDEENAGSVAVGGHTEDGGKALKELMSMVETTREEDERKKRVEDVKRRRDRRRRKNKNNL